MNPGTSTARFMALCVIWTAPVSLLEGLAQGWAFQHGMSGGATRYYLVTLSAAIAACLAVGAIQAALFRKHRAPVPFWILATFLGSVGAMVLSLLASTQAIRAAYAAGLKESLPYLSALIWGSTYGLCLGAAQGAVLWKAGPAPGRRLWIAGIVLLRTSSSLAITLFNVASNGRTNPLAMSAISCLLMLALMTSGTAWLLDRLVFRAPDVEPA